MILNNYQNKIVNNNNNNRDVEIIINIFKMYVNVLNINLCLYQ